MSDVSNDCAIGTAGGPCEQDASAGVPVPVKSCQEDFLNMLPSIQKMLAIDLSKDETAQLAAQAVNIMNWIDEVEVQLSHLDVVPTVTSADYALDVDAALKSEVCAPLRQEEILSNACSKQGGFFCISLIDKKQQKI